MACRRLLSTTARGFSTVAPSGGAAAPLKHRPVMPLEGVYPLVANDAFVAPSAAVVGDVEIHDGASVGYSAVVRGDQNKVKVGAGCVVGDRVTISTAASLESGFPAVVDLGRDVFVGAGSTLRSCMVLEGAHIGENCVISEVITPLSPHVSNA